VFKELLVGLADCDFLLAIQIFKFSLTEEFINVLDSLTSIQLRLIEKLLKIFNIKVLIVGANGVGCSEEACQIGICQF
jgi:serine kinase of HPr protein (carbohydrate metabolism regulator)